ncbi:unnamed protein product [Boreogadus saida]
MIRPTLDPADDQISPSAPGPQPLPPRYQPLPPRYQPLPPKGPALCLDFQRGAAFYTFQKGPALYLPFPRGSAIQTFQKGLYLAFVFADASTSPSSSPMPATSTPDAVTLERHNPESPGDVSNASLTCTAIAVYPVSNISWNVSGVLEHQWKNVVKQDKNSLLYNISSTAFFNCSDGSARLIRCSLGGVSSDEKMVCQQPKATPDAVTLEHHNPESPGDVSNASLTCTAIAVYPVSNISWNVSGVLEHQWKNVVKQDKNSLLFNISSTAFFNCSDGSARFIRCSLGGISSDEKMVCQQPKGEPMDTSLSNLIIVAVVFLAGVAVVALLLFCRWKLRRNPPGPPMPEQDNVQGVELQVFRPRTDETPIRQQSAAMGTIGTTAEKETDETDILLTTGT